MTLNFAHRGFSARYPENTMLSFQKALEARCDGIELDVHLARDGEIVVFHDERLERLTNGKGFVKDMDYAELRKLKVVSSEYIPTLEEYFDLVEKTPIITNIEMKNSNFTHDGMEEKIIKIVRRRKIEDKIILSSLNHFSMLKCKKLAPEIHCGFAVWDWIIDVGAYTKKHGMDSIQPEHWSLTNEALAEIRSHGVAIHTYTVNDAQTMKKLISLGIDAIMTDEPEILHGVLTNTA